MPVGVAGEGGMVSRVLVEPGQWVRAGQVLATIDRSVQVQTAESLASQIAVARSDLVLAQAELESAGEFDVVVVNDDVARAADELVGLLTAAPPA